MGLILLAVVLIILFGGGGGYYLHGAYGPAYGYGGSLGMILMILLVIWLLRG